MSQLKTQIFWYLNDYCKAECSYCPGTLRGGDLPRDTIDYVRITKLIIDHYAKLGRTIDWTFDGGEPLDMDGTVRILKLCKEADGSIELRTSGGQLWMDWWAVEPQVDRLKLTYHYWQNPSLIKYIIELFLSKSKPIDVIVPIRPDHFDEDLERALAIEREYKFVVSKSVLYNSAREDCGMFDYTDDQLDIMQGRVAVEQKIHFESTTWQERHDEKFSTNPIYTGMLCNVGIERLRINHNGWVAGSDCNNQPLGNIWSEWWAPPREPQICSMQACVSQADQQITKFKNVD
jgi:organic radical activating enzyme